MGGEGSDDRDGWREGVAPVERWTVTATISAISRPNGIFFFLLAARGIRIRRV